MGKGFGPAQIKIITYLEDNEYGTVGDFIDAFGNCHLKSAIYKARITLTPNKKEKWSNENTLTPPRGQILWDEKYQKCKAKVWVLNKKNPRYLKYKNKKANSTLKNR